MCAGDLAATYQRRQSEQNMAIERLKRNRCAVAPEDCLSREQASPQDSRSLSAQVQW
jgi:hypothetical protein